ncbi:MAG TPA: hypothetical protein VNQ99_16185 [Xanthobacteraceae bacterium]|nr:hypothetical protein [Xanthobacteraceae bacterium]
MAANITLTIELPENFATEYSARQALAEQLQLASIRVGSTADVFGDLFDASGRVVGMFMISDDPIQPQAQSAALRAGRAE